MNPSMIAITVERQLDGTWVARFSKSIRYHGKADNPSSAISRLVDSFGWDKVDLNKIVEVAEVRQPGYRVFQVPLSESGRIALEF